MTVQRRFTRAVVIGAGFSGIATGCRFKKDLGFHDFTIYERSSSLGGTWWLNQCKCHLCRNLIHCSSSNSTKIQVVVSMFQQYSIASRLRRIQTFRDYFLTNRRSLNILKRLQMITMLLHTSNSAPHGTVHIGKKKPKLGF